MSTNVPPLALSSKQVSTLAMGVGGILVAYVTLRLVRAYVYDALIVNLTTEWYNQVLQRLPKKAKMLDVGIGTGLALVHNASAVKAKEVTVDGVDYDLDYVKRCRRLMKQYGLQDQVDVHHESIYDFQGGPYDAAYFSSSLMLMPDPVKALQHCVSMLKPNGRIYTTQTIQTKHSKIVEIGKPLLKYITTIDFGTVTYEEDLLVTFKKAGLTLLENVAISGSTMNSTRSFRLFTLKA